MELPPELIDDVRKRLRRIAGQVEGVEKMLADGRDCRDVLTQLAAVSKALDRAGFRLVAGGLTYCIQHPDSDESDPEPVGTLEKLFLALA
ncbi:MAG TPA: metal-sensitive transcriptional regulator [Acidimicrobiales bacterium]|nr:metal-sensitive transcriptional regulator [Acidimicrobiales bacterium]